MPERTFVPPTPDSRHGWRIYPNLAWRLQPSAPNQLWAADITDVRLDEAFAYLAVVFDAWSRRVVSWALASHLQASLALTALEAALAGRDVVPGRPRPSLRPRRPVRLRRRRRAPCGSRHPAQHEPGRLPLRQRHGGELHEDPYI